MNTIVLISLIVSIILVLILIVVLLWVFLRKGPVYACGFKLSHNDKRTDARLENIEIYNDQNKQLIEANIKGISAKGDIKMTFDDKVDHLIKKIKFWKIPANCQLSLFNTKGLTTYTYDITTDTDAKEIDL